MPAPDGFMTIHEFAHRVGRTPETVRNYARKGVFRPAQTDAVRGTYLYAEEQVDSFRKMFSGQKHAGNPGGRGPALRPVTGRSDFTSEQGAEIFMALDEGRSLRWCVIELRVHPDAVEAAYKRWESFGEGLLVSKQQLAHINSLALDETVSSTESLVALLETLSAGTRCKSCGRGAREICRSCASRQARAAIKTVRARITRDPGKASTRITRDTDEPANAEDGITRDTEKESDEPEQEG
jgi:hypothetical protein